MFNKLNLSIFALSLFSFLNSEANTVPYNRVELVAKNFIQQTTSNKDLTLSLAYTAYSNNGAPLYYAFNVNNSNGFVLVSAEDAAYPIIGYSTKDSFVLPDSKSNIGGWLKNKEKEIDYLRTNNIQADSKASQTWTRYTQNNASSQNRSATTNTVAPLLMTLWNQSPLYNDSCPGGSVTGCVATTMAQIIKYWNYPTHGTGNSSYCDCPSQGYSSNYGTLKANYGSAVYNYSNMPNSLTSANPDVAKLMYHCGVSVQMDYTPNESGASVICADNPISAQNSYTAYFGYNPNTILGVHRSSYTDVNWHTLLQNDLNIGRPIQYAGFGNQGGHTWVCDGYDENSFYHMNWGWAGSDNGFFNIDALNPGGMDFSNNEEALLGIVPIASTAVDAGVLNISPSNDQCVFNNITPVIQFRNYGANILTSCTINYKVDNQSYQTINWTGSLVTGQTATVALNNNVFSTGSHNIICNTSNPNGVTDGNITNDQATTPINLIVPNVLPIVDGFENQTTNDRWAVIPSSGSDWSLTSLSASGGVKSYMIDNLNNTAGNISVLEGLNNFDLTIYGSVHFFFKVAYQQKTASSNDKLALQVSSNCGKTWNTRWSRQGAALASTTVTGASPYLPLPANYVSYDVTFPYYNSAIFRWVFTSDPVAPGNNLFLDDLNLADPTGIKEQSLGVGLSVYPNPAKDRVTIEFNSKETHELNIIVTDVLGKIISQSNKGKVDAGNNEFIVETTQFKNGVYFLNLNIDNSKVVQKIIVQN